MPSATSEERRTGWLLGVLGGCCLVVRFWSIASRQAPTVLADEFIYLAKALNFFRFGSFYAPEGVIDASNLTPPLYSLLLTPAFVPGVHAAATYRLALGINCLLVTSILYPAYHLLRRSLGQPPALLGATLVAIWPVPGLYSQVLLSEALFVPLFVWAVHFYARAADTGRWQDLSAFGVTAVSLAITRWAGIGLLGASLLVALVSVGSTGRVRWAMRGEIGRRWPMLAFPALGATLWAVLLMEATRPGTFLPEVRSTAGQALARRLLETDVTGETVLSYLQVWWAQLSYLNLATGSALAVLAAVGMVAWLERRQAADSAEGSSSSRLVGPWTFAILAGAGTLLPATLVIWRAAQVQEKARWGMYGRYVDWMVPVLLILILGRVLRPGARFPPTSRVAVVSGALVLLTSFAIPESIEGIHALNHGAAWFDGLHVDAGVPRLLLLGGSLTIALLCFRPGLSTWARGSAVLALALLTAYGNHAGRKTIALYEAEQAPVLKELERLAARPARVLVVPGEVSRELRFHAWLIRKRPDEIFDPADLPPGPHYVLFRDRLWDGADFHARRRATAVDLLSILDAARIVGRREVDTPWGLSVAPVKIDDRGVGRGALLALPDSQLVWDLELPDQPVALRVGLGFHPLARTWGSDGVTMEVTARGSVERRLVERVILPTDDIVWLDLPLHEFKGEVIALQLSTSNEPSRHELADWSMWIDPRIVFLDLDEAGGT